jgi:hypothetical protein
MRPAHVYASMSAEQPTELITALHGPWRNATRIMMIVLSAAGFSASEIADLLHYDPKTVRAWIARHHSEGFAGLPDRPRTGRPRKGSPRLGQRIHALLLTLTLTLKAWTTRPDPANPGPPPAEPVHDVPAHPRTSPLA